MSLNRPSDRKGVYDFVSGEFGIELPGTAWTPGHSTPLDFVAEAFLGDGRDHAAWANRSGMKTLSASILAAMEFAFADGPLRARVLSGSEEQARNLYRYWERWCRTVLFDRVDGDPLRAVTRLKNGDLEILPASQKRVRGAKVQRLFRDEVDEIDADVLAASVGMLAGRDGAAARTIDTSTWHRTNGPMGRLVTSSADRGVRLHKWNIWEVLERCPEKRHDHGRNCERCGLGPVCLAKARQVHADPDRRLGLAAECCGVLAIDDAIRQFRRWSQPQWQAEAECIRPSVEGLVYPQFDRAVHVQPDLVWRDGLPTWRSVDWGLRNFVCLWIQTEPGGRVCVVDEYWAQDAMVYDNGRAVQQRTPPGRVEATFCDPSGRSVNDQTGRSNVDAFEALGLPCTYSLSRWAREVRNGINLIRSYLQPADGSRRLVIAGRCRQLIDAFESYRNRRVNGQYVDEPIKPQPCDHPMDALRYYFVNCWAPCRTETRRIGYS